MGQKLCDRNHVTEIMGQKLRLRKPRAFSCEIKDNKIKYTQFVSKLQFKNVHVKINITCNIALDYTT